MLLILLFTALLSNVHAFSAEMIMASDNPETYDLSGRVGFKGKDGLDAFSIDCSDGFYRNGRDGEAGQNGERGEDGKDAYVYFNSLKLLKLITINQKGGLGGAPGIGGLGTFGCHGGRPGNIGVNGVQGKTGNYGDLYLIDNNHRFDKANSTQMISLGEFYNEPVTLSKHQWTEVYGAKSLFNKKSKITNSYFLYDQTKEYRIRLKWSAPTPFWSFSTTRVALSVKSGKLEVTSYRGAIIDFRITREGDDYCFEVLNAISELKLQNLTFGKMLGQGEDLVLEVKEKYRPRVKVETKFVISLYHKAQGISEDQFIGQFAIKKENVIFDNGKFYLLIGNLNFPSRYKRHDTKLRVHLSIYREANMQTRIFGIKGLFKI
jgi:hypothetical protein